MHATFPQDGQDQQLALFGGSEHGHNPSDLLATGQQLSHIFRRSPSAVSRWALEPSRRVGRTNFYSMRAAVDLVLASDGRLDLGQERARLAAAQADRAVLDNCERARRLIPVEIVMDIVGGQIAVAKNMLLSLGSKLAFELCALAKAPPSDRHRFAELVEREVRQILEELSAERAADGLGLPPPPADDPGPEVAGDA